MTAISMSPLLDRLPETGHFEPLYSSVHIPNPLSPGAYGQPGSLRLAGLANA